MFARPAAFALVLLVAPAAASSSPPAPPELRVAYERLLRQRFSTTATAIPAGGVELEIDSARFRLEAGELRAMEPVAGGRVTGVVFRGRGRLTLELPDSRELDHFRRSAERPDATRLDTEFTALVLRDGGGLAERIAASAGATTSGPFAPDQLALERQEVWLERRLVDADAWVTRALAGDATEWALVEVETPELGWLAVELDPHRAEELQVAKWRPDELATELWISLDRESQRGADGRPASAALRQFDLLHAAIAADLVRPSTRGGQVGLAGIVPRHARFEVELRLRALRPEARTLALELDPWIELTAVRDERGAELSFLRDHVGARSSAIDDEVFDNSVIVLLPDPIGSAERRFTIVYAGNILNYVGGRDWYPGESDAFADLHTAELALTALPKHDLRAMGRLTEERDDSRSRFRRFAVERPVRMVTFSFAEKFEQRELEAPGAPKVIAFAARGGGGNKVHNVAADVSNSWRFFVDRFGPGPEIRELHATSIVGGHGQAFEGFLHLAEGSWENESRGPTELFRAHEVAHEWFGHLVGWSSYRDQWLSEGFADYAAMRFVEIALDDGPELVRQVIETYSAAAMGEGKPSRFQRGFRAPINPRQWRRVGPIALGQRASTADVGFGYAIQAYYRGSLALQMLRRLLAAKSGSDALFDSIVAEWVRTHRGREASTADFEALLTRRAPGDWRWFFRQWVEQTGVPTWRWSWSAGTTGEGKPAVVVEVEQEGVAPGFRSPVPIRIESAGTADRTVWVTIDEARERFTIPVERAAKRVVLNPELAILARMEKR